MTKLSQKVQQYVRQHGLLQAGDRVLVAVSGGADSVILLDVLLALSDQWNLSIGIAHVNHQLRGEGSDGDEAFVRDLAGRHRLKCYVERVDTKAAAIARKGSIQAVARDLRYAFFAKLRANHGFTKIATAHTADDNAETVLLNLVRGAGVRGLSGIPVVRSDLQIIRPLLGITREEIEEYAREQSLAYRTDSSNLKDYYTRNFLRHDIIPLLKNNINPNLTATLGRTAELFRALDKFLAQEAERVIPRLVEMKRSDEIVVKIDELKILPAFLQDYCLLLIVQDFAKSEVDFSTIRALLNLSIAETGSTYSLTSTSVALRDRDRLVLRRGTQTPPFHYRVEPNKFYQFDRFWFSSKVTDTFQATRNVMIEFIDAERLGSNLVLRNWSDGDWFYPLGMHGKKKLSDFFVDAKVSLYEKHSIPVLESDGAIVWVCGKRIDNRFKVSETTKRILKLEYSPLSGSVEIS